MIIGIDYWNVASQAPDLFRELFGVLMDAGNKVYIISAVGDNRFNEQKEKIVELGIPCHQIYIVKFNDPSEAPELKYQKCQELGIELFIDDREDTCKYLREKGIYSMKMMRPPKQGTYDK